jgi:hypothetical protein
MMEVQFIKRDKALEIIRTALGLPETVDRLATLAELARNVLWFLSKGGKETVYITSLLNALRHAAGPLIRSIDLPSSTQKSEPDSARMIVDDLASIGDIVELPRGRWLPAPLRVVTLEQSKQDIVLGGIPLVLLNQEVSQLISLSGIVRMLSATNSRTPLISAKQSEEDWLGYPPGAIDDWAGAILKRHTLQQYTGAMADIACYYPFPSRRSTKYDQAQYFRWVGLESVERDGLYLLRYAPPHSPVNHLIGQVHSRRILKATELILIDGDVRRLFFALYILAVTRFKATLERQGIQWLFTLNNELPAAEQRLFTALGRLRPRNDERYYPRLWEVNDQNKDALAAALEQRLGIRLEVR